MSGHLVPHVENNYRCPNCGSSQRGAEIPCGDRSLYGGITHFSRTIGVEYSHDHPDHYDGVSEWQCPDCGFREGRWSRKPLGDGESEPRYGDRGA